MTVVDRLTYGAVLATIASGPMLTGSKLVAAACAVTLLCPPLLSKKKKPEDEDFNGTHRGLAGAGISGAGALSGRGAGALLVYHPDSGPESGPREALSCLADLPVHPVRFGAAGLRREALP